jgi:DNA-binding LacI/PurR family transcriptional regulator
MNLRAGIVGAQAPPAKRRAHGRSSTVIDVARQAGVSLATVSRVMNGTATVSEEKREKVTTAMAALGFRPNLMAQGLRKGQSNTVALLVGDIAQRHFAELTLHVQLALEESGNDLMLFNLGHQQKRLQEFLVRALSMKLRGVVLALSDMVPRAVLESARALLDHGVSVISVGQDLTRHGIPSIVHEEQLATSRSVEFLLTRGHHRIAYAGRIKGSAIGTARFRGYRQMMQRAGLFDEALVWDRAFRYAAGHDSVLDALARGVSFSAIQAGSDEIAMGAMAALRDRGLRVPDDVAIVGFGDIDLGAYLRPGLTTLSSDQELAAHHLSELLASEALHSDPPPLVTLPRTLVQRQSA